MILFRRKQLSTPVLVFVGFPVVMVVATLFVEWNPIALAAVIVLLLCMIIFGSLTVVVTTDEVQLYFGPGWVSRRFRVHDIRTATKVRNRWWYGLGIRRIPGGWLYNVSGLDAVELQMDDGTYRVGTDRPDELLSAIESARGEPKR